VGIRAYLKLRKEDGAFLHPLIWLTCGLFVILKGSMYHLVGIEWLDIDLIPIFLMYLIGKDQDFVAGCLAFYAGILTDIFAPCHLGLFAFVYSAIVLGIIHCRQFLDFNNIKTSILFVAVFLLVKWPFLMIIMGPSPSRQISSMGSLFFVSICVLATSMVTPFLFYFLDLAKGKEDR